jgi:hypothetical protein
VSGVADPSCATTSVDVFAAGGDASNAPLILRYTGT